MTFLRNAIESTGVRPDIVTRDKAPPYPPALSAVVPEVEHRTGKMEQQEIERDHQHLKGCMQWMRGVQQQRCARVICAGHAFVRNLQMGFYRLAISTGAPRLGSCGLGTS